MKSLLADFQLLLFLCNFMDMRQDLPRICQAVTDLDVPLDEGYEFLIRSIADIQRDVCTCACMYEYESLVYDVILFCVMIFWSEVDDRNAYCTSVP